MPIEIVNETEHQKCEKTARFVAKHITEYIRYKDITYADVGERNKKIEYVEEYLKKHFKKSIHFDELTAEDFNWHDFDQGQSYHVICCFEVLEHLQNPLYFMDNLIQRLKPDGILLLSTPARPYLFYPDFHFFEMPPKHLQKWILEPLGLTIVDRARIHSPRKWWWHLTGLRPFLRIFMDHTNIYLIKRA